MSNTLLPTVCDTAISPSPTGKVKKKIMATEWVPNFNPGIDHYPKFAIKFYAMCFMPQGDILPQLINFAVTLNGKFFYATKLICDFKSVSLENVSLDLLVSTLIS